MDTKIHQEVCPDIFAIFRRQPSTGLQVVEDFLTCLNAVHNMVQFTIESEQDDTIAFLDCLIKNLPNGRLATLIY